jgi:hypothetical protein
LEAGWRSSPSMKGMPREQARASPTVLLPEPETPWVEVDEGVYCGDQDD